MTSTPAAPTVTGYTDANPCPRVQVVVALAADAATVTVTRSAPGIPAATVRGAKRATAAGSFVVIDYEAPFGVPITYTAIAYDASGVPSQTSPASTPAQLDVAELWLSDPLDPTSAVDVGATAPGDTVITRSALTSVTYGLDVQVLPIAGSDLPIGVASTRRQPSAVPIEFFTASTDAGTQLLGLIRQAYPLCCRFPPSVRSLPPMLYASIGDVDRLPWDLGEGSDLWRLTVDSVKGPGLNVIISPRPLDALADEAATLDGLGLLYATLLDLQRG